MNMKEKIAIVLFNLGGPLSLSEVEGFLFNLFNDHNIIRLPNPFRFLLAKFISKVRKKKATKIYELLGGKSPILDETLAQSRLLEDILASKTNGEYKTFVVMRYNKPRMEEVIEEMIAYQPDQVVLLPLYPHFSSTTTKSSIEEYIAVANKRKFEVTTKVLCCYPTATEYIRAHTEQIKQKISQVEGEYRIIFSAHGLPESVIKNGDPYQYQTEKTAEAIIKNLAEKNMDFVVAYQSRVGLQKWLGPTTESQIIQAANDNKSIILVPISFVSEHSETLVELDITYKEIADGYKVKNYIRVPTLSLNRIFIEFLANKTIELVSRHVDSSNICYFSEQDKRICQSNFDDCPNCKY